MKAMDSETSVNQKEESFQGRILVVDDDPDFERLITANLEHAGHLVDSVTDAAAMTERLKGYFYDLILLDINLGEDNGLLLLPTVMRDAPYTRVVMLTGEGSIELAVKAMKRGASGFLTKETAPQTLCEKVKDLLEKDRVTKDPEKFPPRKLGFVGNSPGLLRVMESIHCIKDVDSTVLICGESGTGKELVARALHAGSPRANDRFAAINCGAIPENLLESELFGHKRGAFTDAKTDRKGIFETCSEGTLLLDEIGDMPMVLQVKLLRVLQEREITPIGGHETIKVNTRVIAATHRDLGELVKQGKFRKDLYYRLSVLRIDVPPLRERREDISMLVVEFLRQFNQRFGKSVRPPSHEVSARLAAYEWPGNIRELQNVVERGVVLSQNNELDLKNMFRWQDKNKQATPTSDTGSFDAPIADLTVPFHELKRRFERGYLIRLLEGTRGNISEAARISQTPRTRLYRWMKRYDVDPGCLKTKHGRTAGAEKA